MDVALFMTCWSCIILALQPAGTHVNACDDVSVVLDASDFLFAEAYLLDKPESISGTIDKMYTSGRFEGDIFDDLGRGPSPVLTTTPTTTIANATADSTGNTTNAEEGWFIIEYKRPPVFKLFVLESAKLWPNARVPYVLTTEFSRPERTRIAAAFIDFQVHSCVRFVPRDKEKDADYLYIMKGNDCWSHVGKLGGRQELSLHEDCLQAHGIVLHELLHAIGFWHEHSRSDRDDFVTVHYKNIAESNHYNFEKKALDEAQHSGEPYDYYSVMHYSSKAFSKNGEETITAIEPGITIGVSNGFSDSDQRKVNTLYNCNRDPAENVVIRITSSVQWSDTKDACIEDHNDEVVRAVTFQECKEKCETSKIGCHSVEFLPTSNRCNLSSDTKATIAQKSDYTEPCDFPGTVRPMYAEILPAITWD